MTDEAVRLWEQLKQLPPADRAALAHFLWESLDDDNDIDIHSDYDDPHCDEAFLAELNRRQAEVLAGTAKFRRASEIMSELRKEFP